MTAERTPASPGRAEHSHASPSTAARAGPRYARRLTWSFVLTLSFFVAEVAAGLLTNSLALLSDAGHMLTDVVGTGMALAAIHLASAGPRGGSRTFGLYRLEILAALVNAAMLLGVAVYVVYEAVKRLQAPPEVLGLPMLVVAVLGLAVNLVSFLLLREGAKESLNLRGAYLEVLSDAIGSVGVIVAALAVQLASWTRADPIIGAGIGLFIVPRAWRLGAEALRILLEAAPPHLDVQAVRTELAALPGVRGVHDLHLWTLTSDMEVASAHLLIARDTDPQAVLAAARDLLRKRYDVVHATLQVEPEGGGGHDLTW